MRTLLNICCLLLLSLIILGCETVGDPASKGNNLSANRSDPDDETHTGPPIETVMDIMRAKLAHVHGVLEGLARQNYDQIIAKLMQRA